MNNDASNLHCVCCSRERAKAELSVDELYKVEDNVDRLNSSYRSAHELCWYRQSTLEIEGYSPITAPSILQDQLKSQYEQQFMSERDALMQSLSAGKEEMETKQKAFEVYKDRLKTTCLKLNDQLKVSALQL